MKHPLARRSPKKLDLDDEDLDQESKTCQNRRCTSLARVLADVRYKDRELRVPLCRHCAKLLLEETCS